MTTEWDLPAEPAQWEITIPTDDESIARRRRALAPIQVLIDIERTKANLDGGFWHRYDLFNIALAVIDQVALAMGNSAGRTWDETIEYAVGQAARQASDADRGEWATVAERVVVSLVTTDVETVPYLVHTRGGPDWRAQRFRLLFDAPAPAERLPVPPLRLRRIRLHGVGPDGARFDPLDLDLTTSDGAASRVLLSLTNTGGKSTLITLVSSLVIPASRAQVGGKNLGDYVLTGDTSHVVCEWEDATTGTRTVTGAVME